MKLFVLAFTMMLSTSGFAGVAFNMDVMNGTPGQKFNSKDYPNGVFAVEAYFLTCPYCNYNAENVDELATHFAGNKNVHVLDVGYDCRAHQYSGWVAKHNPNHLVLNDCGGQKLLRQLGVTSYPTFLVIDCNGNVVHRTGGVWNSEAKSKIHAAIENAVAACAAK